LFLNVIQIFDRPEAESSNPHLLPGLSEKIESKTIRVEGGKGKDCDKKKQQKPSEKSKDDSEVNISGPTVIKIEVVCFIENSFNHFLPCLVT
jgi:hypothetical protein